MAEDLDLSEILRSPLDDPERSGPWWPVLLGLALGALAVIGGYAVASSDDGVAARAPTTTATSAPPSTAAPADLPFPPGYEPISDVVAAKPVYATRVGDELFIAIATVFRRGFDAEGVGVGAGNWVLETAAGEALQSTAVVSDLGLGGVVSVVFSYPGEVGLTRLRLLERWERNGSEGALTVPVESALGEHTGIGALDLGGGAALEISRVDLTERSGSIDWVITGSSVGADAVGIAVRSRSDGQDLAVYVPPGSFFFGQRLSRPVTRGTLQLTRGQGLSGDPSEATEMVIEASVSLLASFPADLSFDVSELPVATR